MSRVWVPACLVLLMFDGWKISLAGTSVDPTRVLVVDDDQESRELLSEVLEANGYQVKVAEGGSGIWQLLDEDEGCGIILIDLRMPGESGLELLQKLRQRKVNCDAVIMTSFIGNAEKELALELGVKAFLEKPFRLSELLRVVGELATNKPMNKSLGISS